MGLDKFVLQLPSVAKCLSAETRKAEKVTTPEEARDKAVLRNEKELQNLLANYLTIHGLWFDRDAMHKRRTGTVGTPDFIFPYLSKSGRGYFVAWEVKAPWAKTLRAEQIEARDRIMAQGGEWRLITSLPDAQEHLRQMDSK